MTQENPTSRFVAQGWVLMFLLFVCIFVCEFLLAAINGQLAFYSGQEGKLALKVTVVVMLLHAFVPMLVYAFDARWFRWAIALLTMCFGLGMMLHEIAHVFVIKNREFGWFDLLDFAHHGLAVWVALLAVQWAREGRPAAERAGALKGAWAGSS